MKCFNCGTRTLCSISNTRKPHFKKPCCLQDECVGAWRTQFKKGVKK